MDVRSDDQLGLGNSGATCACPRPTAERAFCSTHGPVAPLHDALQAKRIRADSGDMQEPGVNNVTDNGPADAHARPAPPGGGATAATRLDAALMEDVASIAHHRRSADRQRTGSPGWPWRARIALPAMRQDLAMTSAPGMKGLTFDMSGMTRQAKPAVACPLDGGVRRRCRHVHLRSQGSS